VENPELVQKVLDDHRTAPIDDKLRAALTFLEKMCASSLTPADAKTLRDAGISQQAAADVAYIGYLFCMYTRMADTLSFAIPPTWNKSVFWLLKFGYR
jgi:hypothetical protein